MKLEISTSARKWLDFVWHDNYYDDGSGSAREFMEARQEVEKSFKVMAYYQRDLDLATRAISTLSSSRPLSFRTRIRIWSWQYLLRYFEAKVRAHKQRINDLEPTTNNPLHQLSFHAHKLGTALIRLVSVYNHLDEGMRVGQLGKDQVDVAERSRPVLVRAIPYFEHCVALHQWHRAHEKMKLTVPVLPVVGLQLEELQRITAELSECFSTNTIEILQDTLDGESALVSLQQELGQISDQLGLPLPVG